MEIIFGRVSVFSAIFHRHHHHHCHLIVDYEPGLAGLMGPIRLVTFRPSFPLVKAVPHHRAPSNWRMR